MSKLPNNWDLVQVGKYTKLSRGYNPPKSVFSDKQKPGYVRFIQIRDGASDKNAVYVPNSPKLHLANKEDLLLVAYRNVGRVFRGMSGAYNVALCKIEIIDKENLHADYLYYMIPTDHVRGKLLEKSERALIPSMSIEHLKHIKIPVPPLSEQKRIVSKLDALFERIDESMALLEENIKHTESLMASALDEVFTSVPDEKYSPILDVCSIANKNIVPNGNEVYNYVGLENIESETGRLVEFSKTNGSEIKSSKVVFRKGAVLYGKLRPYLNKVYIADFDGVCTTEILPFYPNCDILTKEYLAFYLRSKKFVNKVNNNTSGARMPRATTTFFKKIAKVPVPTIEVQKKDVEKLKVLSTKIFLLQEEQQDKLKNLKALKESILDKAFKGEI